MSNWVQDCGVALECTGSLMCPLHEHKNALVMQEIRQTVELLDDALTERDGYRKAAVAYQHKFRLTAFALAVVFLLAIAEGLVKP